MVRRGHPRRRRSRGARRLPDDPDRCGQRDGVAAGSVSAARADRPGPAHGRTGHPRSAGTRGMTPLDALDRFTSLRALVVGEAMLDSYLSGHATRLSREAPVPIVAVEERRDMPGGAANAAV